jgi:neutral trehalase
VLPDESGLDDSPKYDPVYGRMAHWRPGYFRLVERCRRLRWDSRAILARTDEHVEDVLVNVAHALSERALARLLAGAGRHEEAAAQTARAQRTEAALVERCWDERRGLFFDLAGRAEHRVEVSTWSALSPLALGDAIPEDIRRRLVEEHLLHPRRYGAPFGIPSVSMDEPAFTPAFDRFRTWRGPAWINTAWLLVPPLRELGYAEEADRIVERLAAAIAGHGFREYHDPRTGRGHGARGFAWSTLAVDLLAPFAPVRAGVAAGS